MKKIRVRVFSFQVFDKGTGSRCLFSIALSSNGEFCEWGCKFDNPDFLVDSRNAIIKDQFINMCRISDFRSGENGQLIDEPILAKNLSARLLTRAALNANCERMIFYQETRKP